MLVYASEKVVGDTGVKSAILFGCEYINVIRIIVIQLVSWIPAFAGMTKFKIAGMKSR